jgi:hypothetical protein
MKKLTAIVLFIIVLSCSSSKTLKLEKRCSRILKNDFAKVLQDKYISIVDNDTIILNQLKYECVFNAQYLNKTMFDRFGKWTKINKVENIRLPLFIWENVKLFDNNQLFIIATSGDENMKTIYASVMVFDKDYNDLLTEDSKIKAKLITYFGDLIKTNDDTKKGYYSN